MRTLSIFRPSQHRLVWLLWLVLLLPLAQTAANWHILSHAQTSPSDESQNQRAITLDYCGQCLSAAVLTGGSPPSTVSHLSQFSGTHEFPMPDLLGIESTRVVRAYDSRAPPFSPL
jgi:hypothetical protein